MQEESVAHRLSRLVSGGGLCLLLLSSSPFVGKFAGKNIPMAPLSAILFSILGLGLAFRGFRPSSRKSEFGLGMAGAVSILGGCLELARMSPLTGLNFMTAGLSILLSTAAFKNFKRACAVAGGLASVGVVVATTLITGYIYGTPLLYGTPILPMALPTALAFLLLNLGLIFALGMRAFPLRIFIGDSTHARMLRALMPIPVFILIVNSIFYQLEAANPEAINQSLFQMISTFLGVTITAVVIMYVSRSISQDIDRANADRIRAQKEAFTSEQNFQGFMSNGPFTAFMRDAKGRYLFANQSFAKIYQKAPEEIIGKTSVEIGFTEDVAKEVEAVDQQILLTNEKSIRTLSVRHMDGVQRHWYVVKFPHRDHAGNMVIGGMSIDISERVKAEEAREEAQEQLMQSYKLASLGELAGNIAHEINNPLAIIAGKSRQLCELIEDEPIDKEMAVSFGQSISETALRLVKIVNGLRTMSRSSDRDPFSKKSVQALVEEALALCSARLTMDDVRVSVSLPVQTIKLDCRPSELSQVLINLIGNAQDATETMPDRWIKVTVEDAVDLVRISVTDSGPGIAPEIQQRIMEPFFTTKAEGKGTGLGLSISKGLIAGHGGRLFLDTENANTCFVLELPKEQAQDLAS